MSRLPAGHSATVRVPATSANLGPGFDSLGLALGLVDEVTATVVDEPGVRVEVVGEGAGEVPCGPDHLVARVLMAGLSRASCPPPPGLLLRCVNAVPHGRGLGSSAAAVIAGALLARALAAPAGDPAEGLDVEGLDDDAVLGLATEVEGHPDNAAAALLGGATVAWRGADGPRAVRIEVHPDLVPLVLLPLGRLATHHARSVLPASVTHDDATANVARAALLVHALGRDPGLLLEATHDRLHQRQRRRAMPSTVDLVDRLRREGVAAVVSGAGPAVLVLSTSLRRSTDLRILQAQAAVGVQRVTESSDAWQLLEPGVYRMGAMVRLAAVANRAGG